MTAEVFQIGQEASATIDLEDYRKAMLNILEDFAEEKRRLEETQRAVLNIFEDFSLEKARYEDTQRAMLNLLDDFGKEREKTEAVNIELREAEKQVKTSLEEKVVLLKEIHHRVKNNLQVIHSMLNLQLAQIKDEQAIQMFKESKDRVYSMALIHEKLYQSESLSMIDLDEYISGLIANLFLTYGAAKRAIRQRIQVEKVTLGIDMLVPCALIINELVSNSLKHAFPESFGGANREDEIYVELCNTTDHSIKLTISDNGVGLPKDFRMRNYKTLGMKLVEVLVKQLRGLLDINTSGGRTEFVITFKAIR